MQAHSQHGDRVSRLKRTVDARGAIPLRDGNKRVISYKSVLFDGRGGTEAVRKAQATYDGPEAALWRRRDSALHSVPARDDQNEPLGAVACGVSDSAIVLERNIINRADHAARDTARTVLHSVACCNCAREQSLGPRSPVSFCAGEGVMEPSRLVAAKAGTIGEEDMAVKLYARLEIFLAQKKDGHATFTDCYAVLEKITDGTPGKGDGS